MNKQKGFAYAFLIIGLVVALIGALGFIFWQNFIHKVPTATKTEIVKSEDNSESSKNSAPLDVDKDDYSFTIVDGFRESSEQMFTYTGSLKAVETFTSKDGDYFEVLSSYGGGGGISGDYFWGYDVKEGVVVVDKKPRCTQDSAFCFASNGSIEGIISNNPEMYYFAFGNKTKNETDLAFVDKFVSTFRLK